MGVVENVLATAGGLIADELKGDLRAAQAEAEAALAAAADDPAASGEARLALGLVAALAGESRRAERLLNAAAPALRGARAQMAVAMSRVAQR